MDNRVGKHGEYKPKLTIGGHPNTGQCIANVGIGNGLYIVVSVNDAGVDINAEIKALKDSMKPKRAKRGDDDNSTS